jgi:hypothetical protein
VRLPEGLEGGYAVCLVWLLLEIALYAVLHQTGGLDSLRANVTNGTYARLAELNEFLTDRFDEWTGPAQGGEDDAPFIRDQLTLMDLKRAVDRAAKFESMHRSRVAFEETGRLFVVVSMIAPFLTAALIFANMDRAQIGTLALGLFVVLTCAILLALLFSQVLRIRIVSGAGE